MNKKASSELNEVWWRVSTVMFVFLIMAAVYGWANSVATGEEAYRKYHAKDIAATTQALSHIPGDAEAYFTSPVKKEKFKLEDYIIKRGGSWVSLKKETNRYKTYADYLSNRRTNIDGGDIIKEDSIVWVKKGDSMIIGSNGQKEPEACKNPDEEPQLKSVLINPSYKGEYPGRKNREFKDSKGIPLIEAEKTYDYSPLNELKYEINDVKATRERNEENPPAEDIIKNTEREGVFVTVILGENKDESKGEIIAEFKRGSELSKYLACLISEKIMESTDDATGMATIPSEEEVVLKSRAEATVLVRVGNILSSENKLLDSKNTEKIRRAIKEAVEEYYNEENK